VNPQGVQVHSFKKPSDEELDHDFLWRCAKALPERGRIGIFNRSYYEEVLIVRVHEELLARQKLPAGVAGKGLWRKRYESIRAFEHHLARNGYLILKFFLHVSKQEQKKRFLARLDEPQKHWKFSAADAQERRYWDDYAHAYEEMIRGTAAKHAPWHVVPADNKWYTRLVVAAAIVAAMERLELHFPRLDAVRRRELAAARRALLRE
jgi:PPK2 family polyphosphate:nucleotide phosphotransferase